jgi:hypothetical protein
MLAAGL